MQEQVYLKMKFFLLKKGFAFVLILVCIKFSGIFKVSNHNTDILENKEEKNHSNLRPLTQPLFTFQSISF